MEHADADCLAGRLRTEPYAVYSELRASGTPRWMPNTNATGGMWLISRYDHVAEILKYRCTSKRGTGSFEPRCPFDHNLLNQDPPAHGRIRGIVLRAFTSERIATLAASISRLADELIDTMKSQGTADFMAEFAAILPAFVIADLLGVPRAHRPHFMTWSRDLLTGPDSTNPRHGEFEAAVNVLTLYFRKLIARRRQSPRADLISVLIQACDAQGRISDDEMLATLVLMLVAGHETTVNMLGNGLWLLLNNRENWHSLKESPTLIPSAIEEILRYESPVQRATFRVLTETVDFHGFTIEAGQQVSALIGAANRDASQFPRADIFDITRRPNHHLAFGAGVHACFGPALARLEGQIVLGRLLDRVPDLRLAESDPVWNTETTAVRGLKSLGVRFD